MPLGNRWSNGTAPPRNRLARRMSRLAFVCLVDRGAMASMRRINTSSARCAATAASWIAIGVSRWLVLPLPLLSAASICPEQPQQHIAMAGQGSAPATPVGEVQRVKV
jgi:hypothetical protein